MAAYRLHKRKVERVWGRRRLPAPFAGAAPANGPVGEIWFEDPRGPAPLLVKYLFTSERLSIQVHPPDRPARARGFASGKDEAWLVLDAEPGAAIGLGLTREVSREALRAAAVDGSIEALVDWRPVRAGDSFYSPAGTVHAIGAGLALVEVQQNVDLTLRLYDYGRPRELHLDEAVAVAEPGPWRCRFEPFEAAPGRLVLAAGGAFVLERRAGPFAETIDAPDGLTLVPLAGAATADGERMEPGTAWAASGPLRLEAGADCDLLVAYPGAEPL